MHMPNSLHDPRMVGAIIIALLAVATIAIPSFILEVLLTVAMSAIIAPGVAWLRRKLRLSLGLTVAAISFTIIGILGTAAYFGIPLFIRGITETLAQLPESVRKAAPFVQDWLEAAKARLEDIFPGEHNLEDLLKKIPELASNSGGNVIRVMLGAIFGSFVTIGHVLLFLVLTAILSGEWDKNADRALVLVDLFAPRHRAALLSFGQKFQSYGAELFLGIFTVMLIFMPIFMALLYLYGGLSLGKSLLFGVILGATSAIPTIGGIITYLILVLVGILNFGIDAVAVKKIFVLYLAAFVIHFAETKFVTPHVLGHRISFTSFGVITVLVGSVLALGIGRGILTGLFLLVALKSLVDVADEGRALSRSGSGLAGGPGEGMANPPVVATAASLSATAPGPSAAAALSMGSRKRRRGRR